MSDKLYNALTQNCDECHWFCDPCKALALHAIRDDREIEERCNAYFKTVNKKVDDLSSEFKRSVQRINKLEDELAAKPSYQEVTQAIEEKISKQSDTASSGTINSKDDIAKLVQKEINVSEEEQRDRERRKGNIVVYGMPESI